MRSAPGECGIRQFRFGHRPARQYPYGRIQPQGLGDDIRGVRQLSDVLECDGPVTDDGFHLVADLVTEFRVSVEAGGAT
ncbi:hypothetical protein SHIRM173S_00104 [Streptomyces hirsutus]